MVRRGIKIDKSILGCLVFCVLASVVWFNNGLGGNVDLPKAKDLKIIDLQFGYFAKGMQLKPLVIVDDSKATVLGNSLILPPGNYSVRGTTFSMENEGLYRFRNSTVGGGWDQRIVFESNIDVLMSSVSWIVSHGMADDYSNRDNIFQLALTKKLKMACWPTAVFAQDILKETGNNSRIVSVLALKDKNGFDDGHAMIEVYDKNRSRYIVYDVANNVIPKVNGEYVNALALYDALHSEKVISFSRLSNDVSYDVSH